MKPKYLGDGVYVDEWNDFGPGIMLTTDSHKVEEAGNVIYFEPSVLKALTIWLKNRETEED